MGKGKTYFFHYTSNVISKFMEESVIYEKALNMKIMTLHEILLFIHSVVLCFDGTICTAYIWNYRASPCSHCRDAER